VELTGFLRLAVAEMTVNSHTHRHISYRIIIKNTTFWLTQWSPAKSYGMIERFFRGLGWEN